MPNPAIFRVFVTAELNPFRVETKFPLPTANLVIQSTYSTHVTDKADKENYVSQYKDTLSLLAIGWLEKSSTTYASGKSSNSAPMFCIL